MGFSVAVITLLLAGCHMISGQTIKCKFLVSVEDGTFKYESETTKNNVGGVAKYSCDKAFKLDGVDTLTCQANGEWDNDIPTCKDTRCPYIMGLQDGTMTKSCVNDPAEPGCTMTFKCDATFRLIGASKLTCGEDRQWDFLPPKCIENHCPHIATFANGVVKGYVNPPLPGTKVQFSCFDRYKLNGASSLECKDDLIWDNPFPTCDCDGCTRKDKLRCPTIVAFPHGVVEIRGIRAIFKQCDSGYSIPFGKNKRVKCRNKDGKGVWDQFPTCENTRCAHFEALQNGQASMTTEYHRFSFVKLGCDKGFLRKGVGRLKCKEDKTWGPGTVACVKKTCPAILEFPNGRVEKYDNIVGGMPSFFCDEGFNLDSEVNTIRCKCFRDRGFQWSTDIPKCVPKT